MKFSWLAFCKSHRIEYITSGAHSARNNIHIKCPWCGDQDRSQHMGLSLDVRRPYFGCWRSMSHRGRNPARLVSALLGCTWEEAEQIVTREDASAVDDYEAAVARVLARNGASAVLVHDDELHLPDSFKPLYRSSRSADRYLAYLESRGFDDPLAVAETYDLHYCMQGEFARRLILPIYHEQSLVNWTGRDVTGLSRLRYSSLSDKPEVAKRQGANVPAPRAINTTVFNYDRAAQGGRTLIVNEGPFDALKIDWYAPEGVHAVGVFGMPKQAQIGVLVRLASRYDQTWVMLDDAAVANSVRLAWEDLGAVLGDVRRLDISGHKDPGAMSARDVRRLLHYA